MEQFAIFNTSAIQIDKDKTTVTNTTQLGCHSVYGLYSFVVGTKDKKIIHWKIKIKYLNTYVSFGYIVIGIDSSRGSHINSAFWQSKDSFGYCSTGDIYYYGKKLSEKYSAYGR